MSNRNIKPIHFYLPLVLAIVLAGGIYLGTQLAGPSANRTVIFPRKNLSSADKLNEVMNFIKDAYVDTVNEKQLSESTISEMLQELDPHSYYIPARNFNAMNEPLEGNFEGIGVEFRIQNDTVVVINPISGGPSEKVGIKAGDRIVKVDTLLIAGNGITNQKVMKLLKGPKSTKVNVSIKRRGIKKLLDFTITRDKIPIYSVDIAYMVTDGIGYINISRFAATTYEEFMKGMHSLLEKGMQKLILDLRGNGGGYMKAATDIADEFLKKDKLIVYTKGKSRPKQSYYATSEGSLHDVELTVLINEGSASASEILAGAIQDNDRGTVIGRRSFGKGLVQEQLEWPDGSAVRLTVARYYTPTGRCIQRPYENGSEEYRKEAYERLERGELMSADSIDFPDSLKYITEGGKVVYGGGGIMPDVFIPLDTSESSNYYTRLSYRGIFQQFGLHYAEKEHEKFDRYEDAEDFLTNFKVDPLLVNYFVTYAKEHGVKPDPAGLDRSRNLVKMRIKASLGRHLFHDEAFYPVINSSDKTIKKAVKILKTGKIK